MQSGVFTFSTAVEKEKYRFAFVRLPTGLTQRCRVLKEASDGSSFVVELDNRLSTVSSRHLWFDVADDLNGYVCVVCFTCGLLLTCKQCGRRFHEDCSSMPRPKKSAHPNTSTFTCRDCFFMLYASCRGMERSSCARNNSLLLIKEVKKYSTYAYRELRWDALFRSNNSSIYCYCGGPGDFSNQMVQCLRCLQWFHRVCLHCLPAERDILPWDCFWFFKCSHCNGNYGEVIRQLPVQWPEILHLAIMNLTGGKPRFCNIKADILPWLEKNWKLLRPARRVSLSFETDEKILRRLQSDPARFQCAMELGGNPKDWRTRCCQSGPLRQDMESVCTLSTPISQERLNDLAFERTAPEDLPLLTLHSSAKLPSINNYECIYGNKENYKIMERRLQSSRLIDYDIEEKTMMVAYRPDEDRSTWLSHPDFLQINCRLSRNPSLTTKLKINHHHSGKVVGKRKATSPLPEVKSKKIACDVNLADTMNTSVSELKKFVNPMLDGLKTVSPPGSSTSSMESGSKNYRGREDQTVSEKGDRRIKQRTDDEKEHRRREEKIVDEKESILRKERTDDKKDHELRETEATHEKGSRLREDETTEEKGHQLREEKTADEKERRLRNKRKVDEKDHRPKNERTDDEKDYRLRNKRAVDESDHRLREEKTPDEKESRLRKQRTVDEKDRRRKEWVNDRKTQSMTKAKMKTEAEIQKQEDHQMEVDDEEEEEEEEPVEPPTLRPRVGLSVPRSRQVARKSGRPAPLCVPSPPRPVVKTRACSVTLINVHNWFEITGDRPPQRCSSGAHVLHSIPPYHQGTNDRTNVAPFSYRWESSYRPRYSRSRIIRRGLPVRHATSTPLTPRNPRKKSAYDSDGVTTVLARRRQLPSRRRSLRDSVDRHGMKDKGKFEARKEDEKDDIDEETFQDLLLLWNRKLVRIERPV